MSARSAEKEVSYTVDHFKKYKDMLKELTKKNLKLKYRNSVLGVLWSFLEPTLNMIVLTVVFGGIFGRKSAEIICYPIWMFTGRMLFDFFRTATTQSMTSFRRNSAIIRKVYVPKYMYPLSSILSSFVNFVISLTCLAAFWLIFKFAIPALPGKHLYDDGANLQITWYALMSFVPMLLLLIFSAGVGLILSVMAVFFKDIEYIWQVTTRLLMYMIPVLYPLSRIKQNWTRFLIKVNPLYSYIELFRQCVLYGYQMSGKLLLYGTIVAFGTLGIGILVFNKFNDKIVYHL